MGLHIIVVGAGIGGFASAVALRQAGHQVTVFEKYENNRQFGFAVAIPPNCTRVLESFGLDFTKARMNKFLGVDIADATSFPYEIVASQRFDDMVERYGAHHYAAHRADLHEALRELATGPGSGTPVEVREGMAVVGYGAENGSVTMQNGDVISADLVVAADGVKSKAHKEIIGEERPATLSRLSNVRFCMATETMLNNPKLKATLLQHDRPTIYRGTNPDVCIFRYPCRNNTLQNFGCYQLSHDVPGDDDKWRSQSNWTTLFDRLGGFDDYIREIARSFCAGANEENNMYLWKIADRENPLPAYQKQRLLVLGDAAHPLRPIFGMGAAWAIEDAGVLGVVLRGVGSDGTEGRGAVAARVKLWEELRWRRASLMQLLCKGETVLGWYRLSDETIGKMRELVPESEWPELTKPGVDHWCFVHECLKEAEEEVKERFVQ